MNHLLTITTIVSLSVGALQGASNTNIPLRPTLPEPQATELQKLENSFGLKNKKAPEPVAESSLPKEDHDFLTKAAEINIVEIESAKAAAKSTDPAIRHLAEQLGRGHHTAQKQLEKLAASKGITLPAAPGKAGSDQIAALQKKTGHEFDKQFLLNQQKGHQEAILFFEKEAKRTGDADIKAWAEHMVPGLKAHLTMIREVELEPVAEPAAKAPHAKTPHAKRSHLKSVED